MSDPFGDKRDPLVKAMERSEVVAARRSAIEECERIARKLVAGDDEDDLTEYGEGYTDASAQIASAIAKLKDAP